MLISLPGSHHPDYVVSILIRYIKKFRISIIDIFTANGGYFTIGSVEYDLFGIITAARVNECKEAQISRAEVCINM